MTSSLYANVPTGAGNTVVSASAGVFGKAVVTTTGTGTATVYDNATTNSGQILLAIPASAPVGTIYPIDGEVLHGITVANTLSGPVLTVYYD